MKYSQSGEVDHSESGSMTIIQSCGCQSSGVMGAIGPVIGYKLRGLET